MLSEVLSKYNKIILVGDSGVGKTRFVHTLLGIQDNITPTIGANVYAEKIWDISGNNTGLIDGYFIGADMCIIFYDTARTDSFRNMIRKWKPDVSRVTDSTTVFVGTYRGSCPKTENWMMTVLKKYERIPHVKLNVSDPEQVRKFFTTF